MKWTSWAFFAFMGALAFSVLIIADYEMDAGVDRLSKMKLRSTLEADPNLKLISEGSPYMRTER
jgi:hypothetical protein